MDVLLIDWKENFLFLFQTCLTFYIHLLLRAPERNDCTFTCLLMFWFVPFFRLFRKTETSKLNINYSSYSPEFLVS